MELKLCLHSPQSNYGSAGTGFSYNIICLVLRRIEELSQQLDDMSAGKKGETVNDSARKEIENSIGKSRLLAAVFNPLI